MINVRVKGRKIPGKYGEDMIAVSIEARKKGRRKSFKTGVRVPPKHWDKENSAVKTSHNEFLAMNTVIV